MPSLFWNQKNSKLVLTNWSQNWVSNTVVTTALMSMIEPTADSKEINEPKKQKKRRVVELPAVGPQFGTVARIAEPNSQSLGGAAQGPRSQHLQQNRHQPRLQRKANNNTPIGHHTPTGHPRSLPWHPISGCSTATGGHVGSSHFRFPIAGVPSCLR